ncbi:MAG: FAD-dependent 5-carboxymethylaminomethyl-2-thiouridine(34) oxidoreductase MnmC [Rubrivivax sp.]|nr:FAD-dependent 5-carboxymethylaminomethyl-2-thiouridine(34) oxidoreductase MnmC [Rubrivivax sp.]
MKTEPIVPARLVFEADGPPRSELFGDIYHPRSGALDQARQVFLAGNGLPSRWRGRRRFVILETGFGLGNNFLATWQAWRDDPQRPGQLVHVAIEKHPPSADDLARAQQGSPLSALAEQLLAAWPPLTPGVHLIDLEGGRVRLLLALGEVTRLLPALELQADAFYLDGFAPACNPAMWSRPVMAALGRRAAPDATAATWSVAREVREGLRSAGFEVERVAGSGGKRQQCQARYAPAFVPRRPPSRRPAAAEALLDTSEASRHALIIGAGLAGAAVADALARQGWRCTVLDRHAAPAQEASGNAAGLFHGTEHADDGPHARFTRAAALLAAARYRALIEAGRVAGRAQGLLRLRPATAVPAGPEAYVKLLTSTEAADAAGLPLPGPAWLYAGGGWIAPGPLCRHWLAAPGIVFQGGARTARILRMGEEWQAWDEQGRCLASAPVVVLAVGAAELPPMGPQAEAALPALARVRGQVSCARPAPGWSLKRPLAGHGYVLQLEDGRWLFGATSQADEDDPAERAQDHGHNRARLASLLGRAFEPAGPTEGRVGFRAVAADRLPLIGALPLHASQLPPGTRLDQCRYVPRLPGAYAVLGLASRGLTWAPLAAEIVASWITGAPMPLESDLLDAVDPARALVREARRSP